MVASLRLSSNPSVARSGDEVGGGQGLAAARPAGLDEVEVRRVVVLATPPERVWEFLADPERLSRWLGGDVEVDLAPGGRGTLRGPDGRERRLRVEAVDPPRRLAFRWWPFEEPGQLRPGGATRVELVLDPVPDGTRVTVRERPAPGPIGFALGGVGRPE